MSLNNFLLAAFALTLTACNATKGSGNKVTEEREVDAFTAISLDCSVDLTVEVGPKKSVSVWADDNLIQMITTKVSNGELIIDMEGNYMTSTFTRSLSILSPPPKSQDDISRRRMRLAMATSCGTNRKKPRFF